MAEIRLVRHGRAAAGWDTDVDPPLDDLGRAQARAVADELRALGPLAVVTSPLRRCRETAHAYADPLGLAPVVAEEVREIPSPEGYAMAQRVEWLRSVMAGEWGALGPRYTGYRDAVVDFVTGLHEPTVVYSHFVAINAVIGACLDDDRLVIRRLDNCSVTTVSNDGGPLRLVSGGTEADTLIR
jgi:broad specificity phosphatase PhoE